MSVLSQFLGLISLLWLRRRAPPARITTLRLRMSHAMTTATLTWSAPTTRAASPSQNPAPLSLAEIAEFDVYDAVDALPAVQIGMVTNPRSTNMLITNTLVPGVHVFTVTTKDTAGNTAAASNMVSVTVPAPVVAPPAAITDLAVMLNA